MIEFIFSSSFFPAKYVRIDFESYDVDKYTIVTIVNADGSKKFMGVLKNGYYRFAVDSTKNIRIVRFEYSQLSARLDEKFISNSFSIDQIKYFKKIIKFWSQIKKLGFFC